MFYPGTEKQLNTTGDGSGVYPLNIDEIFHAPSMLRHSEKLFIFSFIIATQPRRVLEIGTRYGGTAAIICKALDFLWRGELIMLDPNPVISVPVERLGRARVVKGRSPQDIPKGQYYDLVFVDGEHTLEGVIADTLGVLPWLRRGGYLLYHDAHFEDVRAGIEHVVATTELQDCGLVGRDYAIDHNKTLWGGLWLLYQGGVE